MMRQAIAPNKKSFPTNRDQSERPVKRVRYDVEIPVLPILPREILNEICRLFYTTAQLLSDCLQMSLVCVAFRRLLDAISDDEEKRHDFLTTLGQRCMVAFKKYVDFRYLREGQCIKAFEMSYALRVNLVGKLADHCYRTNMDSVVKTGFVELPLIVFGVFQELGYSDDEIYGKVVDHHPWNENYVLPIVSKALCNVNDFLGHWLNLKLVFRKKHYECNSYKIIQYPFQELICNAHIIFAPLHTQMFQHDGKELSFIFH